MYDSTQLPNPAATMEVMPAEVAVWHRLSADERPYLVDCREPEEIDICRIEGSVVVRMGEIPGMLERLRSLADEKGMVIYCHHGMRSLHASSFLRERGVERVFSMAGGIELWARLIDSEMARY